MADYQEDPYQHIVGITIGPQGARMVGEVSWDNPGISSSNQGVISFSLWFRANVAINHWQLNLRCALFLDGRLNPPFPDSHHAISIGTGAGGLANILITNDYQPPEVLEVTAWHAFNQEVVSGLPCFVWHHAVGVIDTISRQFVVYIDGQVGSWIDRTDNFGYAGDLSFLHDPFTMELGGTALRIEQHFNGDPAGAVQAFDVAELWWAPGQDLRPLSSKVARFIKNGAPVDLGADGSAPTGTPPVIFGHGGPGTFLAPNLGTGGNFAQSGTVIDPPDVPHVGL